MKTKPAKANRKPTRKQFDASIRRELLGDRQPSQSCDEWAAEADRLSAGLGATNDKVDGKGLWVEGGKLVAYEDGDDNGREVELVTIRQEITENFSKFKSDFGSMAAAAAIAGNADFFDSMAGAIRRRENRAQHRPNARNLSLLKSLADGKTPYGAAKDFLGSESTQDDNGRESAKKQAARLLAKVGNV